MSPRNRGRSRPRSQKKPLVKKTPPRQKPHRSRQDYSTPPVFLDAVRRRLGIPRFLFDFAATGRNATADAYWAEDDDALTRADWAAQVGEGWGWLNPPFGHIDPWASKCWELKQAGGRIAFLVPASVGANWFKRFVHRKARMWFLNGRLGFLEDRPREPYPKDCLLALYAPELAPGYDVWDWRREETA